MTTTETAMNATTNDDFLSAQEAADYLRMSLAWVRLKTSSGELPHSKLGTRVIYERSELARWVREQQATPRPRR